MEKSTESLRYLVLRCHIRTFKTFVKLFERTAEGVHYYVKFTPEDEAETHKEVTKRIMKMLWYIKDLDVGAYKAIVYAYEDELREVMKVYRQLKKE